MAAPAKVPPAVVGRVEESIHEITELPDVQARMLKLGMSVDFRRSDQFRDMMAREDKKYGAVVAEAGIQPK